MRYSQCLLLVISLLGHADLAMAKPWWTRGVESNENDFLPPDVAFRVAARVDGDVLRIHWVIADGYYLYRHKMGVTAESPDLVVAALEMPRGIVKTDPYLGRQETFRQQVDATAAFTRSDFGAHPVQIKVTYQGCADAGLCYPPITQVIFAQNTGAAAQAGTGPAGNTSSPMRPWEAFASLAGIVAFLAGGLWLRKGRHLDEPSL